MSDFFEFSSSTNSNNNSLLIDNNILYRNFKEEENDIDVISFIVDKKLSENTIEHFIDLYNIDFKFQFLYCSKIEILEKDSKKSVGKYYYNNRIDFNKYIKPFSKVITFGRCLYCFTYSNTDIQVECFYDMIFNNTYFYSSENKNYIFPCNMFFEFFNKDNFENYFFKYQLEQCIKYENIEIRIPTLKKILVNDPNKFLLDNMDKYEVAFDIETTGFDFIKDKIFCITFSFDGKVGYYLRYKDIDKNILNDFFKNKYVIGQNVKFDCKFLRYEGIDNVKIDYDTLNASHILNEMRSNSLKSLSYYYTYYGGYEKALDDFKDKYPKLKDYSNIPEVILYEYAVMDSIITFQVYLKTKKQIEDISNNKQFYNDKDLFTLKDYYYNIVIPSINMYLDMELKGLNIDVNELNKLSIEIQEKIKQTKLQISKELNINENQINLNDIDEENKDNEDNSFFELNNNVSEVNISSNDQLGVILEKKGFEDFGRTKKGNYNVSKETLLRWSKLGRKEADTILQLHEYLIMYKTFVGDSISNSGYYKYLQKNSRIYPTIGVMINDSGRNNCYNPNMQQVPSRGWKAEFLRRIFTPPNNDYVFCSVDYSGLQLRLSAMMITEKGNYKNAFLNQGGDLHSVTAYNIFLKDKEITLENKEIVKFNSINDILKYKKIEPVKSYRFKSKSINFGLLFGMQSYTFAKGNLELEWKLEECKNYIKDNNLNDALRVNKKFILKDKHTFNEKYKVDKTDNDFCYYKTVSEDIRNKFFITYYDLLNYMNEWKELCKKQGYSKSIFGGIRRLPFLLYIGKDENKKRYANYENISLNSHIQNMEVCVINSAMVELHKWLKDNNKKSYLFLNIHDAIEMVLYKPEIKEVCIKIKEVFTRYYDYYNEINLEVEGNIADYFGKNQLWDLGEDWDNYLK